MDGSFLTPSRALHYGTWLLVTGAVAVGLFSAGHRILAALPRLPRQPAFLGGLVLAFTLLSLPASPTGDEPHYLLITQSLLRDGDLDLRNNYQGQDELEYVSEPITDPHVNVVGEAWYPVHGIGLPLLAAPWFALAGRAGVVVMLALMTVLGLRALWSFLRRTGFDPTTAAIATLTAAFTLPLAVMGGQAFPEVPAFMLTALVLRAIVARGGSKSDLAVLSASVAALPWLHPKYALLVVALLGALFLAQRPRSLTTIATAGAVAGASAAGLVLFHWLAGVPLAGPALIPVATATPPDTWLGWIPAYFLSRPEVGLAGALLDQQSGLFLAAPVWMLAAPGVVLIWRKNARLAVAALLVFLGVYLPAGAFTVWYGGFASPARLLTPVVPVLALGIGAVLQVPGGVGRVAFGLLAAPSLVHAYLMATLPSFTRYGDPATDHNYFVALAERTSGLDLTLLLPSFRHVNSATWLTALGYLVAITLIALLVLRRNAPPPAGRPAIPRPAEAS